MFILMRLVKMGMGSWNEVIEFDANVVLQALCFEKFISEYENAYLEAVKDGN